MLITVRNFYLCAYLQKDSKCKEFSRFHERLIKKYLHSKNKSVQKWISDRYKECNDMTSEEVFSFVMSQLSRDSYSNAGYIAVFKNLTKPT